MSDLFAQLNSFRWRNIEFPCESFELDISQDQAEHKWPDRDGAHVEGTGMVPRVFTAKALFLNGIKPGIHETQFGQLYPNQYRLFIAACSDRTTGVLQHPEFGNINAKCKSVKTHWAANRRDGVVCDVVWVESDDITFRNLQDTTSPVGAVITAATELDDALTAVSDSFHFGSFGGFSDLTSFLTSIVDTATLFEKQVAGKIANVGYQLERLSAAVDRLKDPRTAGIRQAIERLRDSLNKAKVQLLARQPTIAVFIVPKAMTLGQVAAILKASPDDLAHLNAGTLVAQKTSSLPSGTRVRYYARG